MIGILKRGKHEDFSEDTDFTSGNDEGWAMSKPNENLQFYEKTDFSERRTHC